MAEEQPVHHRTIAGQTRSSLEAYLYTEFRDNAIRDLTAEWHHEAITLWLWSLRLFEGVFSEGLLYHCGAELESDECQAYWDRRSLLALGGRGAKPALDLLLAGYYTEAFAIERTMVESWVRAVCLRLQPEEHKRFGSDPDPYMGLHAVSHGVFVQRALLNEIKHLKPPVEKAWFEDRKRFSESAEPLIVFTQGALAEWSARHELRCLKKPTAPRTPS